MSELQSTFLCVGGLYTPVLPVGPDDSPRTIDGIHYFSAADVARDTGQSIAAVHESYAVFLKEVGDGLKGSEGAARVNAVLRERFRHLGDEHFEQFLMICKQRNCNPFGNELWADSFYDERHKQEKLVVGYTVDGHFAIAHRTGELLKVVGPEWCAPDGHWSDVWLGADPPAAARTGILRRGMESPVFMVATWRDYAPFRYGPDDTSRVYDERWLKMPAHQLAKCSSCLGIRRAFADHLDGYYSPEEMAQARNPHRSQEDVLESGKAIEEDLPMTGRQFRLRLIDYGIQDPTRQEKLIEQMRKKHPVLYIRDITAWYHRVIADLRAEPAAYGALAPEDAAVAV